MVERLDAWDEAASACRAGLVAIGLACAIAVPALAADAEDIARAYAAGYRAQFTCSALWNGAGKSLADIERDELTGIYPEIQAQIGGLKAEVDAVQHRVSVRYRDDMPPRVALWDREHGCVGLPIGAQPLPIAGLLNRARSDLDNQPWPLGDKLTMRPRPRKLTAMEQAGLAAKDFGGRTSALLIVKDGRIAWERYQPGHDMHTAERTWSVAKSIAGTLIGHAVERGQIDVTKSAMIAEWQSPGDPRGAITTEQLMRMASGLTSDSAGNRTDAIYMGGASVRAWTTAWPLLHPPGQRFRYANNDSLLAILSLKAAQQRDPEPRNRETRGIRNDQILDPVRFFDQLGMTRTFAEQDKDGDYILSSQVWTTARDMARLGLLYQNDGMANGKRLLPADWRAFVTRASGPQPEGPFGYGATFWLMNKSRGIPPDAFAAFGNRGQYLVIIPSHQLVIVRRGYDDDKARFDIEAFTRAVIAADLE